MRFDTLDLDQAMLENIDALGFKEMTEIQEKSLPVTLKGIDVIAKSKTGSGKTVAFGIPLLQNLDVKKFRPQALVLAPTRELADQVATELRKLAKYKHNIKILTLCGGMPMRHQMNSLFHGAHIVVGTPGRIQDHIGKDTLDLKDINTVVLDEADRMLDMGFVDSIEKILESVPKDRQTMLFSATFEDNIKKLSAKITDNPQTIQTESGNHKNIEQIFYTTAKEQKFDALVKLLKHYQPESAIIFCNMKVSVTQLCDDLYDDGFDSIDLQGDLEQRDRTEALLQFSNRSSTILVATDVAARGLDIKEVDIVINYDLPRDTAHYTHRIGRTGRAGQNGLALSLISKRQNVDELCKNPVIKDSNDLKVDDSITLKAPMQTLCINGGKKHKLRAGDILGVLCKGAGLEKDDIGKINLFDFHTYVAVKKNLINKAVEGLGKNKIKKRSFKAYKI